MRPALLLLLSACTAKDPLDSRFTDSLPEGGDSGETGDSPLHTGDTGPFPQLQGEASGSVIELMPDAEIVSFTLPFARGEVAELSGLRLDVDGQNVPFQAEELTRWWSAEADDEGVRTAILQFEATWLAGGVITARWGENLEGEAPGGELVDVSDERISGAVDQSVGTAERSIVEVDGQAQLVELSTSSVPLYSSRQPRALVALDPRVWAQSGALGDTPLVADWESLGMTGLAPLGQGLSDYARSSTNLRDYKLNSANVLDPTSPNQWEFGRCSTLIQGAVLTADAELLTDAHRLCGWYTGAANTWAGELGLWTLGAAFSGLLFHGRDLYEFSAVSGDLSTLSTTRKLSAAWLASPMIQAYREGRVEGDLWTEQLLGAAMSGLWYGFISSGEPEELNAVAELVATLHVHSTGSDAELLAMGVNFPSQGCLVHDQVIAGQGEDPLSPWCSPWEMATLLDPLLQYRALTQDPRVDEILVAWGRYLRDQATSYALEEWTYCDRFLEPLTCYEAPEEGADPRMLIPLFSAALNAEGQPVRVPIEGDFTHCPDVSAIAAASLAALQRRPDLDEGGVGPFGSELESLQAMHQELAACAVWDMAHYHRERRNPAYWTSDLLAEGLSDPAAFIARYKIGYADYVNEPLRQFSWWFNAGLLQVRTLADAGFSLETLEQGHVQPVECADLYATSCE